MKNCNSKFLYSSSKFKSELASQRHELNYTRKKDFNQLKFISSEFSGKILALFPPLLAQVSLWCLSSFDLYLHLLGMQDKHDIVLAAISSSRSDWVTKFVRSSSFFDSQVFLQFEAYYVNELPTIVLGVVIFCMWWTLLKLWSWSLKLKIDADFEVAVWRGRLM